ncbi:ATP-binding cassette domain-containing protein [Streptococcus mutans]|jgi:ABC-type antimicrobial peptide transport system, ATPase component|uniref:ABC transporter, membrane protein subunit and ATP-binding protein n=2 Tax=Streptococcus mutans TaxID=1309 RepID=Q8DTD8_STRMU|nr:ATP-binding cassette domain-containing protein [Streptococcus mutans]AAN59077.1 putative ABC transporter, membrane protein subunit and ATP-binding protein [Streptococcus mutans UA159]AJD55697.1 ABC transporter membrane protein subunit and ATP-binding protein [Streptococcus mutans UA159-FR]AYO47432.1 ATP-binding cassette domain-containing protein [Streptococcus mutans]EMB52581.1 putative ABC transporter, membrane protein subunit and ATP-binding protein [Streptococcus mutans 11A1]EMB58329.1 p
MLELKHITKVYETAGIKRMALENVSVNFRANEFVAVLGQSGSGKTTLLNIIGGLDQYTTGDLLINGKSTKDFKDKDWDSYRNNTIGFVFQSYNLISHQTALANVELALTLSGVSKAERRKRALDALKRVGLEDEINKKPNQMSGGQMQRVAIARALVNNPDILLADEPTGALDSETSLQIMDLLKEIAQERLVIMVTHNPDLAEKYSNRIIKVLDGHIINDSNPYTDDEIRKATVDFKKTKMSFTTALSLSFNNLLTKKGRTLLTAFAGSIGIIGIALILSLSNGVQKYIAKTQEDTLVAYPLSIEKSSNKNFIGLLAANSNENKKSDKKKTNKKIGTNSILKNMISTQVVDNDLASFKTYIKKHQKKFAAVTKDIQYSYKITPRIYQSDTSKGVKAVNPNTLSKDLKDTSTSIQTVVSNLDIWQELSSNEKMLSSQYQVISGHLPKQYNEVVLMADENNKIDDYVLYSLGIKDAKQLNSKTIKKVKASSYHYKDLIGRTYKLVINSDLYQKEGNAWIDRSDNDAYMKQVINAAENIKIVGIVKPQEGTTSESSSAGVGYSHDLTDYLAKKIKSSTIAKEQLANKKLNVFTGQSFSSGNKTFSSDNLSVQQQASMASMSAEELADYVNRYNENANATYKDNLEKIGIIDNNNPETIHFYASSFKDKEALKDLISDYNKKVKKDKHKSRVIRYTDTVGLMMSSVTTMINAVTYILIGFVAISLIVSSIMIGIITYISVLERTKEIGVLRAMGASKRDVTRIFTAETIIEGAIAGVLGILITLLLNIAITLIVKNWLNINHISSLPIWSAIVLIAISIVLTVFAGILPSRVAAKKDPVEALRTE